MVIHSLIRQRPHSLGAKHSNPHAPVARASSPWKFPVRSAFTLVEAIVATIILGVALTALLGLTTRAVGAQTRGEHLATAAMLADNRLNLVLALGPEEYPAEFDLRGTCESPFEKYAYEIELDPKGQTDPYDVFITISWQDAGRLRTLSFDTKLAPRRGDEPDPERAPDDVIGRNAE